MAVRCVVRASTLILVLVSFINVANAEVGSCRYDDEACSCSFGGDRKGTCWDVIDDDDYSNETTCGSRQCRPGWSCTCGGRTHLCAIRTFQSMTVDSYLNANRTRARCSARPKAAAAWASVKLGGWNFTMSRSGMLRNACGRVTWYHNGDEMADFDNAGATVTAGNVDSEIEKRAVNTQYAFKEGDLVALRLRNASYFCLLSEFSLRVNGTERWVNNTDDGRTVRFARRYSTGWNQPWFVPHVGVNEVVEEGWKFFPLRKTFFATGAPILPGVDYWRVENNRDHEVTNFYFRVQL